MKLVFLLFQILCLILEIKAYKKENMVLGLYYSFWVIVFMILCLLV